jgi:hypothetical protein
VLVTALFGAGPALQMLHVLQQAAECKYGTEVCI